MRKILKTLSTKLRKRRFEKFKSLLDVREDDYILDVGGLPWDWIKWGYQGKVLCLSLSGLKEGFYGENKNIEYRKVDVTNIPFEDNSFEVVYSNSLLEHVGEEHQERIISEIKRVGKKYWVQVPNRNFIFEPHYKFPFYHFFPRFVRLLIAKHYTAKLLKHGYYLNEVDSIALPNKKEFTTKWFPGDDIYVEKFYGLKKSFVAYRTS